MSDLLLVALYESDLLGEGHRLRDDASMDDVRFAVGRAIEKCYALDAIRDALEPFIEETP